MSNKLILLVDDSNSVRQSVGLVLEQAGFSVIQASDGVEAQKKMDSQHVDMVITDINMPHMDGIELTKVIRSSSGHRFTPVLMLTTESQESKMAEGKAAGATGWIVKPFDPDKLIAAVNKLLG